MAEQPSGRDSAAEAEALFQLSLRELSAIVWSTDSDLRFTSSLGAGLSALNLRHDEVVGMSLFEFFRTDDPAFPAIAAHRRALQGESISFDQAFDDCVYHARVDPFRNKNGEIIGCIGVAQDITELRRANETLREERNRAREYLDIAGVILVALDRNGHITLLNQKGHDLLEYNEGQLVGKNWFDTCLPDHVRDDIWSAFVQLISGDLAPVEYVENPVLSRAGREKLIAWHNTVLSDEAGHVVGTLSSGEDITEKRQAQEALRRAHDELERRVEERTAELTSVSERLKQEIVVRSHAQRELEKERVLLKRLLASSDRERTLTAYEIHDGLAQQLAAAVMQLDTLESLRDRNSAEATAMLHGATETLRESLAETRRLISGLRPPILDEMGVVAAIRHLLADQPVDAGPRVAFSCKVEFDRLEPVLENAIFRIVQEGVTNVQRHSKSEKVRLELVQDDDVVRTEIEDWGVGFDLERVPADRFGLAGIRERARVLGGRATIDSTPGQGTRIIVDLPVAISDA